MPTWRDIYLNLLCELYKLYGGDCADLDLTTAAYVAAIQAKINADPPATPPQASIDALVAQIRAHLLLSDNDLTAAESTLINGLLDQISTPAGS